MGPCCSKSKPKRLGSKQMATAKSGEDGGATSTTNTSDPIPIPSSKKKMEKTYQRLKIKGMEGAPRLNELKVELGTGATCEIPRRPKDKSGRYFVALFDYTPVSKLEITLTAGELVRLLLDDDTDDAGAEWKFVTRTGHNCGTGYVPRTFVAEVKTVEENLYYLGRMTRVDAEDILRSYPTGTFFVRDIDVENAPAKIVMGTAPAEYALSLKKGKDEFKHFIVKHINDECGGGFMIGKARRFESIAELVVWHMRNQQEAAEEGIVLERPLIKKAPDLRVPLPPTAQGRWREIPRGQIQTVRRVGQGNFGFVYEGRWTQEDGTTKTVAIKVLKKGTTSAKYAFMKEAAIMKKLSHKNLVQMFGVVTTEEPLWLVQEFMNTGSLKTYLTAKRRPGTGGALPERKLIDICLQVAAGMEYLEGKKLVHRDMAARNILVHSEPDNENLLIKIADFGMAKMVIDEDPSKNARKRVKDIPTRWTAPEALDKGIYSTKSDVWSYGVLVYEVFTFAKDPFPIHTNAMVRKRVVEMKLHLTRDPQIPLRVFDELMVKCFAYEPASRPSFKEIYDFFNTFYGDPIEPPSS